MKVQWTNFCRIRVFTHADDHAWSVNYVKQLPGVIEECALKTNSGTLHSSIDDCRYC